MHFHMDLHSPEHSEAIVGIPKRSNAAIVDITLNGASVWQPGKAPNPGSGARFIGNAEHYIKFALQPGTWTIQASYATQPAAADL